ncbi:hypothetical protein F511_47650 [Dorcoceras hygrometricum]|uniref:Uncharacterized protein n=1 Tax=Dorcoceras hygrometricum TaxID=472368 RepID=A0A2Z6ZQJ6_9LAMI|nr:hypothetical protein F511_47650 [Dorcoceras hygrometricum]
MAAQVARPVGAVARTGCTKEPCDGRMSCARRCALVGDRRQVAARLHRRTMAHGSAALVAAARDLLGAAAVMRPPSDDAPVMS